MLFLRLAPFKITDREFEGSINVVTETLIQRLSYLFCVFSKIGDLLALTT